MIFVTFNIHPASDINAWTGLDLGAEASFDGDAVICDTWSLPPTLPLLLGTKWLQFRDCGAFGTV